MLRRTLLAALPLALLLALPILLKPDRTAAPLAGAEKGIFDIQIGQREPALSPRIIIIRNGQYFDFVFHSERDRAVNDFVRSRKHGVCRQFRVQAVVAYFKIVAFVRDRLPVKVGFETRRRRGAVLTLSKRGYRKQYKYRA